MKSLAVVIACFIPMVLSQGCDPEDTHYYPDSQFCDRYTQCRGGVATEEQCPDGLLYNDLIVDDRYPCEYPNDVDCGSRTKRQPSQPTENCGNQWGVFSSGSRSECGYFFNCVGGREFVFNCPEGLAFSSLTYRCEYADQSPDCDVEAYLGFSCPNADERALQQYGEQPRYRSSRDCRQFYLCAEASPRLLSCEEGLVFDETTGACAEQEAVRGCDDYYSAEELKAIRDRKARRAARLEQRKQDLAKRQQQQYQ